MITCWGGVGSGHVRYRLRRSRETFGRQCQKETQVSAVILTFHVGRFHSTNENTTLRLRLIKVVVIHKCNYIFFIQVKVVYVLNDDYMFHTNVTSSSWRLRVVYVFTGDRHRFYIHKLS